MTSKSEVDAEMNAILERQLAYVSGPERFVLKYIAPYLGLWFIAISALAIWVIGLWWYLAVIFTFIMWFLLSSPSWCRKNMRNP